MSAQFPHIPPAAECLSGLALNALPDEQSLTPESARAYCKYLATRHYENFTVVSWFLPGPMRAHFYNIYAYCRWSDDIADETGDSAVSLKLLDWWEDELDTCFSGVPRHPVFVALKETVDTFDIPIDPFKNLLAAFRQDQSITTYETYDDLLGYCRNSANPVGHLILYLCGYDDAERQQLSDATCTGLQLANFWQDIRVDLQKDRVYMPISDMTRFGYSEQELRSGVVNDNFLDLMRFEVDRARGLFNTGLALCERVNRRVRADIDLFNRGGMAILDMIERQGFDVLSSRPTLTRRRKVGLMLKYALLRLSP